MVKMGDIYGVIRKDINKIVYIEQTRRRRGI